MRKLTATLGMIGVAAGWIIGGVATAPAAQAASCAFSNVTATSYVQAYNNSCSWIQGALTSNGNWIYGNKAGRGYWTTMSACYSKPANQRVNYAI
ncbi:MULTISPECIES: hypothetical protein [unclassified Leifsonia]|uniref:hypothetical protein n=1 Tax=unclassified Leifsonia TaxID=2663824 RepID=UPI0008A7A378|nr:MULTISPECIES: hypothetical protein [unclassified Leifsonia]SEH69389.1 hypothetical protein SAMN04515694_102225 [Leifsonia sp. CL154]SFL30699.1 hypothetical protein SAMN04515692_102226 [Leifsonia sp. CL147]